MAHQGITKCVRRICAMYWWKSMDKRIEKAVRDCSICKIRDAPLTRVKLPEKFWEKVAVDCVGPYFLAPSD